MGIFFFIEMFLGLVPAPVLILLLCFVVILGIMGFRKRRIELAMFLIVAALEMVVLVAWSGGITAACGFESRYYNSPELQIFDPQIENIFMGVFWIVVPLSLLGIVVGRLIRRKTVKSEHRAARIASWLLLLLITICIHANDANSRRMGASIGRSTSPDGQIEVSLVPMNCMIDTNGLLIYRSKGEFWWHPIASFGDVLTSTHDIAFDWPSNRRVVVFIDGKKDKSYDFDTMRDSFSMPKKIPATKPN